MHPALDLANPFKTSPAPSSAPHISPGEREPSVMPACGAGELAAAESSPVAASIPPGYVLVRIELLETLHTALLKVKERERAKGVEDLINPLPAFLRAPSASYLDAIERRS